jgi:hypothetical protein
MPSGNSRPKGNSFLHNKRYQIDKAFKDELTADRRREFPLTRK